MRRCISEGTGNYKCKILLEGKSNLQFLYLFNSSNKESFARNFLDI
jgi:hypothetical protein